MVGNHGWSPQHSIKSVAGNNICVVERSGGCLRVQTIFVALAAPSYCVLAQLHYVLAQGLKDASICCGKAQLLINCFKKQLFI